MTTATKTNRTLQIDGMKGEDCCKKVTGALKGVNEVSTRNVKVGSATIEADQTGCTAACKAIDGVGFKAHESGQKHETGQKMDQSDKGPLPLAGAEKSAENKGRMTAGDKVGNPVGDDLAAKDAGVLDETHAAAGAKPGVSPEVKPAKHAEHAGTAPAKTPGTNR